MLNWFLVFSLSPRGCVCAHACAHLSVVYEPMCACVENREHWLFCALSFPWDRGLSLNLVIMLVTLAAQQTLEMSPTVLESKVHAAMLGFLHGCKASELRQVFLLTAASPKP